MSKEKIKRIFTEDQRLVMLRTLAESPNYTTNDSMLDDVLELYSHNISRERVRNHLTWLEDMDLVTLERIGNTLVATLTQAGLDVSTGERVVEGVKRPGPGM